jgi:ABC-type glutathione transport system ATPase component
MNNAGHNVLTADLSVDYRQNPGVLRNARISVDAGEIVGLVGQSGSGKSTLAMAVLGLLPPEKARVRGSAVLCGREICGCPERELRTMRGRIASLIPQDPVAALNPVLRIGTQLREAWLTHAGDWKGRGLPAAKSLLASSGLPDDDEFRRRYPDQISVGQAQRVLIAMSLLHDPALLIADEPTSALDLITQREVLNLLARINDSQSRAVIFISHDLAAVASLCHRVAILHGGEIVECERTSELLQSPRHPFTRRLIDAIPDWRIAGDPHRSGRARR